MEKELEGIEARRSWEGAAREPSQPSWVSLASRSQPLKGEKVAVEGLQQGPERAGCVRNEADGGVVVVIRIPAACQVSLRRTASESPDPEEDLGFVPAPGGQGELPSSLSAKSSSSNLGWKPPEETSNSVPLPERAPLLNGQGCPERKRGGCFLLGWRARGLWCSEGPGPGKSLSALSY